MNHRVAQYVRPVEADVHHLPDVQNQQHHNRAPDPGQRHVPDLLQLVGAVNLGRLKKLHVDARNGGKVQNGAPSHALPYADEGVGRLPVRSVRQEGNALVNPSPSQQRRVDNARLRAENLQHHTADDNPAQKVRQIQQRLGNLLEGNASQLVQQNRQDNRHRETRNQPQKVQPKRVPQSHRKVRHVHHELEVLQPDPFAAPHALEHVELLKGNNQPQHGLVAENQVEGHRQHQHQVQPPVSCEPAGSRCLPAELPGRHRILLLGSCTYWIVSLPFTCIVIA